MPAPVSRPIVASISPRSTWRDARRLPAGVAMIVVCIIGMVALPYWTAGRAEALTEELRETLGPLEVTLERVHRETLEIANDIRGFWLTGDRGFVSNFVTADVAVRGGLAHARELAARSDTTLAREVGAAEQAYSQWASNGQTAAMTDPERQRKQADPVELFATSNARLAAFGVQMERTSALTRAREDALRDRLEEFRRFERVVIPTLGGLAAIVVGYLGWLAWALLTAQRTALEERDQLEAVLASVDSGVLLLDSGLRVAVANERAADLLGVSLDELVGADQRTFVRQNLSPRMADPSAFAKRITYLDENPEAVFEDFIHLARPQQRVLSRYGGPVRDESGAMLGRIEVYRDVTDTLRRERELADANERKDRFVATLSHELRTPLTPILGWIELLGNERDPRRIRQGLDAIRRNVHLETQLVEDLLDLSRVVNQKLELDFVSVDVRHAVEAAVATVAHLADAKGVRLEVSLPSEPLTVAADETRFIQVIWNLLSNAIKFTPAEKRVSLTVAAPARRLQVVVEDEGEGIPPEFLPHIFKPFEQGHDGRRGPHGGLGIGLALARSLVALHKGEIVAESAGLGRGARFTFWIPRDQPGRVAADSRGTSAASARWGPAGPKTASSDPPAVERPAARTTREEDSVTDVALGNGRESATPAGESSETASRKRVLVVEDNPDTLEAMRVLLESWGYDVKAVNHVAGALASLRDGTLDAIISDIGMPDVDGLTFAAAVRKLDAGRRPEGRVFLIAITGFASRADRERAIAAGFDAYLTKPIDFASLRDLLDRATATLEPQRA
jgi:signal transduction histidine kinase/ActR/RegA family two-component response regulator